MAEGEDEESHWDYHHNKEKAQILNPVMLANEEDFLDDNDNGKNENVWNQDPDKGDLHWGPSVARPHLVHNDYHDREKHHGHSTLQNVATAVIHPQHPNHDKEVAGHHEGHAKEVDVVIGRPLHLRSSCPCCPQLVHPALSLHHLHQGVGEEQFLWTLPVKS